jgi:hypothetical protein
MVVGVMRILVLIKFLNVKFISVKIGDPITSTVTNLGLKHGDLEGRVCHGLYYDQRQC